MVLCHIQWNKVHRAVSRVKLASGVREHWWTVVVSIVILKSPGSTNWPINSKIHIPALPTFNAGM
jgi:hypothetical protein